MKRLIHALQTYLDQVGMDDARIDPATEASRKLPVFIAGRYETYRANFLGKGYCLLACKGERPSPAEAEKHAEKAAAALGEPIAFVFASLPAFERKRLIQRHVPFIVPQRQVYLPTALVDLREPAGAKSGADLNPHNVLPAPAQAVLLFYLQKPEAGKWPLNRWVQVFGYSPASLTRTRRGLEDAELCDVERSGTARLLRFPHDRRALWEKARPRLQTPVRSRSYVAIVDARGLALLEAGLPALSHESTIAPGATPVHAVPSSAFPKALRDGKIRLSAIGEDDAVVIERWRYAPAPLSNDGRRVDRLSLYLSLQHDRDERVQAALHDMLEKIPW
jgi:hypothetical protein